MALKIDIKTLPPYVKAIIVVLPAVIIAVLLIFMFIMPKQKEIQALDAQIDKQSKEIASNMVKAEKLDILIKENERLQKRLAELKLQLPAEKEISSLLKQVSDLGSGAGLIIKAWKPGQKKDHPSGIINEIPVSVSVIGKYHNLGYFFSSLTKLQRIVNINDMKASLVAASSTKGTKTAAYDLAIDFTAATFSSLSEEEIAAKKTVKKSGK